jgi:hypothetical protein
VERLGLYVWIDFVSAEASLLCLGAFPLRSLGLFLHQSLTLLGPRRLLVRGPPKLARPSESSEGARKGESGLSPPPR